MKTVLLIINKEIYRYVRLTASESHQSLNWQIQASVKSKHLLAGDTGLPKPASVYSLGVWEEITVLSLSLDALQRNFQDRSPVVGNRTEHKGSSASPIFPLWTGGVKAHQSHYADSMSHLPGAGPQTLVHCVLSLPRTYRERLSGCHSPKQQEEG